MSITEGPWIKFMSTCRRYLKRSSAVPSVKLNLRGAVAVLWRIQQSFFIFSGASVISQSIFDPLAHSNSKLSDLMDGCRKELYKVRSSFSVHSTYDTSLGLHLFIRKSFSMASGWCLPYKLTYQACNDISRPLSRMYFMDRSVGTSSITTRRERSITTCRNINETWIVTCPADLVLPPMPFIIRKPKNHLVSMSNRLACYGSDIFCEKGRDRKVLFDGFYLHWSDIYNTVVIVFGLMNQTVNRFIVFALVVCLVHFVDHSKFFNSEKCKWMSFHQQLYGLRYVFSFMALSSKRIFATKTPLIRRIHDMQSSLCLKSIDLPHVYIWLLLGLLHINGFTDSLAAPPLLCSTVYIT